MRCDMLNIYVYIVFMRELKMILGLCKREWSLR